MRGDIWERRAARVRECAAAGMSLSQTAKRIDINRLTISRYRDKFGIEFKPISPLLGDLVKFAEQGLSLTEAAARMACSYQVAGRIAREHNIQFRHHLVDQSRIEQMAALYLAGYTMQQIGEQFGVTRARVQQIVAKHKGLRAEDGGQHKRAEARQRKLAARKEANCLKRWGCTYDQWRLLLDVGEQMRKEGAGFTRTPTGAFGSQRNNARKRGIEWNLTLWQWWTIWQQSGHWAERGRGQGYVMCREGDEGPYAVGNVFIALAAENSSNRKWKKSGLPIGVQKIEKGRYKAFVAKRSINGQTIHIGSFKSPELAHAAYLMAGA